MWKMTTMLALLVPAMAQYYVASTVAGNGPVAASASRLVLPRYAASAPNGDIFISDSYFNQVYRVTPGGVLSVLAGTGQQGFAGDGGAATAARLDTPGALLADAQGGVYIADQANGRIRYVAPDGTISTRANPGAVAGIALDRAGNLYVTLGGQHVVRRLGLDGTATTYAGTGTAGFSGDGGAAISARLSAPSGLRFDGEGNLYIADTQNNRIRRVAADGTITTVAGNGSGEFSGDRGPATQAALALPADVAVDTAGNLYIADASNGRVRMVNPQGQITTIAGGGGSYSPGPATSASLPGVASVWADDRGGVVISVAASRQVWRVDRGSIFAVAGAAPTLAGSAEAAATSMTLLGPVDVALDGAGNLYVADSTDHRVMRVRPDGRMGPFAGNGFFGFTGNNGPATAAPVGAPRGLATDRQGNLYIVAGAGATLRRVAPGGIIALLAGGRAGYGGDGGPASSASFLSPAGVATDRDGNIFVADTGNHRVRRIAAATGVIETYAGTGTAGYGGDGGPASQAQFNGPRAVAVDAEGNVFVADAGNHRIRRIGRDRVVTTVAGNGAAGFGGDGGAATEAPVGSPLGVAVDGRGALYVTSSGRVRKIDGGRIGTIGGGAAGGFGGDGGLGTNARFDLPMGLAVDESGAVFVADTRNYRVRKLTPARIVPEGVTNGATLKTGPVAPGLIVSLFGFDLGPAGGAGLRLDAAGRVATELEGTRVLFDGIPAPVLYASANQVNVVVPYGVRGPSTQVEVSYRGRVTNRISLAVAEASPGVFAVTNQDGSLNGDAAPAAAGSVVILYGTGEGRTEPAGVDGQVANAVFPRPSLPVRVTIGGKEARVLYAGAAPGFVAGVFQMNVEVPEGVTGQAALSVRVGDTEMPEGVRVAVR